MVCSGFSTKQRHQFGRPPAGQYALPCKLPVVQNLGIWLISGFGSAEVARSVRKILHECMPMLFVTLLFRNRMILVPKKTDSIAPVLRTPSPGKSNVTYKTAVVFGGVPSGCVRVKKCWRVWRTASCRSTSLETPGLPWNSRRGLWTQTPRPQSRQSGRVGGRRLRSVCLGFCSRIGGRGSQVGWGSVHSHVFWVFSFRFRFKPTNKTGPSGRGSLHCDKARVWAAHRWLEFLRTWGDRLLLDRIRQQVGRHL